MRGRREVDVVMARCGLGDAILTHSPSFILFLIYLQMGQKSRRCEIERAVLQQTFSLCLGWYRGVREESGTFTIPAV